METENGTFEIVPQWEEVTEVDILTPRDVFNLIIQEGYKVKDSVFSLVFTNSMGYRLITPGSLLYAILYLSRLYPQVWIDR